MLFVETSIQSSIERGSQFSCKVAVVAVLTLCALACVCMLHCVLAVQRAAEPCPACLGVSDFSVVVVGLLQGLAGYWQHPSMGPRWQFPSCSLPLQPSLLPGLKVAQTADYMSTTAEEEVTHHTVEIRLNKLFLGCLGVFNPNMESCLSWPGLGWIRKLQTVFLCTRVWRKTSIAVLIK